jgi:hypothetical protein
MIKIDDIPVNRGITLDVVVEAVERNQTTLDDLGFCICCGVEAQGGEPDARRYECESCGFPGVFGAEELLIHFLPA